MVVAQADVRVRLVQIHAIPPAMVHLHLQVVRGARPDVQAVVPVHVVADVQVRVAAAVPQDARVLVEVAAPVHAVADVLQVVQQDVKVLVVQVVHQVVPENAQILVAPGALRVVPDNAAVAVHQAALMVVKRRVPATVPMVAIPYVVEDANILAGGRVNMFPQALLAPAVQGHVAPIVITLAAWLVAQAVCLAASLHQNDVKSNKRTRSRLAIRKSQKHNLYRD